MYADKLHKHDVFISYHPDDYTWVNNQLLPRLQKAGISYIDYRNFQLGNSKINEIEKAICESQKTLLIVSSSYISNNWKNFENSLVSSFGMKTNNWPAIPIIIESCDLPPRMEALVFIDLTRNDLYEWKRLIDDLKSFSGKEETIAYSRQSFEYASCLPPSTHNLPPHREFVNRKREKARIIKALNSNNIPLVIVDGLGGMGKTVLAIDIAYDCIDRKLNTINYPFQYCIFISAKSKNISIEDFLDEIARELDYPYICQKTSPSDKPREVYRLLQSHRVLLVVDNFETIQDANIGQYLENIPEPSKAIITTRIITGIKNPWRVTLEGLNKKDAIKLIRNRAKGHDIQSINKAQDRDIYSLVSITGGNPLALETSLGYMKNAGIALNSLVGTLSQGKAEIFDEIFSISWLNLTPSARKLLMSVSFFIDSASKPALKFINDFDTLVFDQIISQLLNMSLIYINDAIDETNQRFSLHPLTISFLINKVADNQLWEKKSRIKWAKWYISFALNNRGADWLEGYIEKQKKLDNDWKNILAAFEYCRKNKLYYDLICEFWLDDNVSEFIKTYGYWDDMVFWLKWLMHVAEEQEDFEKTVLTASGIIWALTRMGGKEQLEEADHLAKKVWNYRENISNIILCKLADDTSTLYVRKHKWEEAIKYFDIAINLLEKSELDYKTFNRRKCHIYYYKAELLYKTGKEIEAKDLYQEGYHLALEGEWSRAIIFYMNRLADIAIKNNEFDIAQMLLDDGISNAEKAHNTRAIALYKKSYATLEAKIGKYTESRNHADEAWETFRRLGMQAEIEEINAISKIIENDLQ